MVEKIPMTHDSVQSVGNLYRPPWNSERCRNHSCRNHHSDDYSVCTSSVEHQTLPSPEAESNRKDRPPWTRRFFAIDCAAGYGLALVHHTTADAGRLGCGESRDRDAFVGD